ncbi:hypothetical protein EVJ58_g4363 [Rhodofomes roseus]|uniref:F-box domain-containing protein n=1 Tax=Rhodofomes roseus TaxID=34475 RepID=A0A4Y9YIL1_9APHY|nr:hypothetical protein EVJ58_g4363 [Rhodofomes roseus]
MASPQRVLRPRKHSEASAARPSTKRQRLLRYQSGEQDILSGQPLKLPLELILLILAQIDSPRTLADASRVCKTLQPEIERLLYREVRVARVPQVRSLHLALTRAPGRASFVRDFLIHDNGRFANIVPLLNEVLPMFTDLEHLDHNLHTCFADAPLYKTILRTLSDCPFKLRVLECFVNNDRELIQFLRRQADVEFFSARPLSFDLPEWELPEDVLPRLKYLQTDYDFFLDVIPAPRMITHLSLCCFPTDLQDSKLDAVLRILEHQLISLRCNRTMPNLKFLEVNDVMAGAFLPCTMNAPRSNVALDTLVWSASWLVGVRRDEGSQIVRPAHLGHVRPWVKTVLSGCRSLQRFFYVERCDQETPTVTLFTLSAGSELVEVQKAEKDVPIWSDI